MSLRDLKSAAKKPSSLIRFALADLEALEKDERYAFNFAGAWHDPTVVCTKTRGYVKKCYVCLAGASLARHVVKDPNIYALPHGFTDGALERRLYALNDFRMGVVGHGIMRGWGWDKTSQERRALLDKVAAFLPRLKRQLKHYPDGKFDYGESLGLDFKINDDPKTKSSRATFRKNMKALAKQLERVGL